MEGLFGPTLAEDFGLRLFEPPLELVASTAGGTPEETSDAHQPPGSADPAEPAFVKPLNESASRPTSIPEPNLPEGFDEDSPVLIAEVVVWEKEFRCFVMDREP